MTPNAKVMTMTDRIVLPLQSTSHDTWVQKYQLKDQHGVAQEPDVDSSKVRVARTLAQLEKRQYRKGWEKQFRETLEYCIPAGRIMSNTGAGDLKAKTSLINCVVSNTVEDSMESILTMLHEAGITLKAGCGIGYEFSTLRPKGAHVAGAGASTSGPLSFMDIYDAMCSTISSAGGRRGAQMATFDVSHPDVVEFVKVKREDGRLRKFNLSLLITDKFLEALRNDQLWVFEWAGVPYGTPIRAVELWDLIMRSTYEYAEPGILLIDRINNLNNLWFCENIRATNPCVTGDTLILTNRGYKRIDSLVDKLTTIWNGHEWSDVTPKVTGRRQKILEVTFSTGAMVPCTPYHGFHLEDGTTVEAQDLVVGDKLERWEFPVIEGKKELSTKRAYTQGFYSGDGSRNHNEIWLYEEKISLSKFMSISKLDDYTSSGTNNRLRARVAFPVKSKTWVPSVKYTIKTRLDWLAGLLDSDGCYQPGAGFTIWSVDFTFLDKVRHMLHSLGVSAVVSLGKKAGTTSMPDGRGGYADYESQDSYRLIISKYSAFKLLELGLDTHKTIPTDDEPQRSAARFVCVTSIVEREGLADKVYCFNEPKRHTGIFNGIMTSQCGEQPLPPSGSCNLGSVLLPNFVRNPFQHNATFDFAALRYHAKVFSRLLDNVCAISGLPLASQESEILSKRRHGMGIMGLGSAMTMLHMSYGDHASVQFTEQVMRTLAIAGYEAGYELAKEKGEAPILKQKFESSALNSGNGRFNKKWQQLQTRKSSYTGRELMLMSHFFDPWYDDDEGSSVLRGIEKYGSRYTHAVSVAPAGTISLSFGNNCSNGVEPTFSHYYVRNKIKEGSKAKEAVSVYSYEFLLYKHLVETGKVKHVNSPKVRAHMIQKGLDENTLDPAHMPEKFSTADSVTPDQHIAVQEAAQKWTDSSISKTINVPTNMTFDDFKDVYRKGTDAQLKGLTTFRFNPDVFQGVLVRPEDLKNTMYKFTSEDGSVTEVSGDTMVQYEGGTYTAANLFDAMKEGYYNKL